MLAYQGCSGVSCLEDFHSQFDLVFPTFQELSFSLMNFDYYILYTMFSEHKNLSKTLIFHLTIIYYHHIVTTAGNLYLRPHLFFEWKISSITLFKSRSQISEVSNSELYHLILHMK